MEDIIVPLLTFLFIIGSGIVKVMNENKEKEKQKQSDQIKNKSAPRPQQQVVRTQSTRVESNQASRVDSRKTERNLVEQKSDQLDALKRGLNISASKSINDLEGSKKNFETEFDQLLVSNRRKHMIKEIGLESYLTRKGLAGSVVMAEVLGKPRSKNPYRVNDR